ncbi:MAG: putative Ig domain-containing protein, partial [Planctomycetota bacterium]
MSHDDPTPQPDRKPTRRERRAAKRAERAAAKKQQRQDGGRAKLKPETLEQRILLSASWVDADTGDPVADATAGDDLYLGDELANLADGGDGDDTLFGGLGGDTLTGGDGDDTLVADGSQPTERTYTPVVTEDFSSGATGWSDNTTETDPTLGSMLGRFGGSGGAEAVSKTFDVGESGDTVYVAFDFHRIDSWDNEQFKVFVDGNEVMSEQFLYVIAGTSSSGEAHGVQYTITPTSPIEDVTGASWQDQSFRVELEFTASSDSFQLGFGSTLNGALSDESYGIGNLEIGTVEEPVLTTEEALAAAHFAQQTALVVEDDFTNPSEDWSHQQVHMVADGSLILGLFGGSGGAEDVTRTFPVHPSAESATFTFDLWAIDSHDGGEAIQVFIDGVKLDDFAFLGQSVGHVWSGSNGDVTWSMELKEDSHAAGRYQSDAWWQDKRAEMTITVNNPGDDLRLGFGSTLSGHTGDESYGFGDFRLEFETPEPSNLITGGNFDMGGGNNFSAGDTFGAWTVEDGDIQVRGGSYETPPGGGKPIDLNGSSAPGTISQTFATEVGQTYTIEYQFGAYAYGGTTYDRTLDVSAGDTTESHTLTYDGTWTKSNLGWTGQSMTFTATDTTTTLTFASTTPGTQGPHLGNVEVYASEPVGDTLEGGAGDDVLIGSGDGDTLTGDGLKLVHADDFTGGTSGWRSHNPAFDADANRTTDNGGAIDEFLGRHRHNGDFQKVFKDFALSGEQDFTRITLDYLQFDGIEAGENTNLFINDNLTIELLPKENYSVGDVITGTTGGVEWQVTVADISHMAYEDGGIDSNQDIRFAIELTVTGNDTNVRIGMGADLDGDGGTEGYGIDNLRIWENTRGRDTLTGGGGDDTIDGGLDTDTAIFTGDAADYTITKNPDGTFTVADSVADRDGTDTLTDVERFRFADQTFYTNDEDFNDAPTVENTLADQTATADSPFTYQVPADAFADADAIHGDTLTYTATLANGDPLPAWLSFDDTTRTFSGTPDNGDVGSIDLRVTATDGSGESIADEFTLTVDNTNDAPTVDNALADQTAT